MNAIARLALALAVVAVATICSAREKPIQIVVWDERQPKQKSMYENFLGNHIADYLRKHKELSVQSVGLDDPQQGVSDAVLDGCDVLIWWGHVRQDEIKTRTARRIVKRVKTGELGLIVLHSAHWSTPFMLAMEERTVEQALAHLTSEDRAKATVEWGGRRERNAPGRDAELTPCVSYEKGRDGNIVIRIVRPNCCFPEYAAHGKPSKIETLLPGHPIAKGIAQEFTPPQTEMYGEPFHVPAPDAVIFKETWQAGQWFRAGAFWNIGKGKLFYFRPGHENFSVFHQPEPLKIVTNAAKWLGHEIIGLKKDK
ncbi:MAG: ThuA domain-containing protein [Phycisphaerales bacterium]|nr:MAG: ThuA domain-containing protein [Phycisphaerales bacterium]